MGKPNQTGMSMASKDSAGTVIIVGIVFLAVGVGIGYYFGKSTGAAVPVVTSSGPAPVSGPGQTPGMDPAVFLATESTLKAALVGNPKDLKSLVDLGNLYYDNNKFQPAIDYYGKVLELNPNDVSIRTDRGSCYWSLGQADPAIADFQKSLQQNPSHPQTLFNLGIVYLHGKNDIAEARKAWERLLATNPDYPQRERIQQMLASMSTPPAASLAAPAMPPGPPGQAKPGGSSAEELLKKMKK